MKLLPTGKGLIRRISELSRTSAVTNQASHFLQRALESGWLMWCSQRTRSQDESPDCGLLTCASAWALHCSSDKARLDNEVTNAAKIRFCVYVKINVLQLTETSLFALSQVYFSATPPMWLGVAPTGFCVLMGSPNPTKAVILT